MTAPARRLVAAVPPLLLAVLDAAGLGLFCVTGAVKALDHRMPALSAVLLGTVTGVGGVVRESCSGRSPPCCAPTSTRSRPPPAARPRSSCPAAPGRAAHLLNWPLPRVAD